MNGRPHSARLLFDLRAIREELTKEIERFGPDEIDWTPAPGMKSCRAMVQEIAMMETLGREWAQTGQMSDWMATNESLKLPDADAGALIRQLQEIRTRTVAYLESCTEEQLETPQRLPDMLQGYFSATDLEPEEMIRWIIRHEYYHLGQLIIYRWSKGDNPYKR